MLPEFRVVVHCSEIAFALADIAKRVGYKETYHKNNETYFHFCYDQFSIYDGWAYKPPGHDFISIEEAVILLQKPLVPLIKIGDYKVIIDKDIKFAKIGCQTIGKEKIKEILDRLK